MPGKNGLELAKDIRRESPDIPLIALSAYLGADKTGNVSVKQCEEAGFTAYSVKPFSLEPFLATINACVKQRDARLR
jgi:CheY-like chemotaxis protein